MDITKCEFAEYIKTMRKTVKLTQQELADYMNLSKASVVLYENPENSRMPRHLMEFIYNLQELIKGIIRERRNSETFGDE